MKTRFIHTPDLKKAMDRRPNSTQTVNYVSTKLEELKQIFKQKKYFIHTFGCQANVRDEETLKGMLSQLDMVQTDESKEAEIIIINTCAVRENAEDKVYGIIGNIKGLRRTNKNLVLAICGCMVEQPEILERLIKTYPEVNLYFGTHEIAFLYDLLYLTITTKERIVSIESKQGEVFEGLPTLRNNEYKAYVNIIYGCDKFCTYCIVPYTRGKERSRTFNEIVDEVRELKKAGYQEITLLGQNVNAYGKDLKEGKDFADLLEAVALMGIPRIRFTTSHPWDFTDKMIEVIASYDNIMKFIHLPVQSGNNNILRKMGRRYSREDYLSLVDRMKKRIPDLMLSTDIIVGFPNETEEEFNDTLSLVDLVKYDAAFTFIYSPRKGTPAAKMEDNASGEVKSKRFKELVKHLEVTIEASSKKMIGNYYQVLVDGKSKNDSNMYSGYTEGNKLVHFKGDDSLIGKIVLVKIIESHTYSLIGELITDPIIIKAFELKKELLKEPLIKRYFVLKNALENNEELSILRKEITLLKSKGDEINYNIKLKEYNNNPLIMNFYSLKEEVESLLFDIKNIIE